MEELRRSQIVDVKLDDGTIIKIKATDLRSDQDVVDIQKVLPFNEVTETIKKIAQNVRTPLNEINIEKASVEFGIEVGVETSGLTALLAKGTGTGSLKITLEWGK